LKKISEKRKKLNKRVGIKGGRFQMEVNFRDQNDRGFDKQMQEIQSLARRGWFPQWELAQMYGISVSRVAKIIRCDPKALRYGDNSERRS